MSIMENIRGPRADGDESGGGKYNPFRILEIGESMIRYCDGIRIKNYNFLGILTSDRLVLIESAQQSAGTIAKEIPVSLIQGAVLERDEKNRPALGISMEVGGQTRLMRLVFTGLIDEPETECREWFTAINGYPPQPEEKSEPIPEPVPIPVSAPPVPPQVALPQTPPPPVSVIDAEMIPAASVSPESPIESPVVQEPVIIAPTPAKVPEPEPVTVAPPVTLPPNPPPVIQSPFPPVQVPVATEPLLTHSEKHRIQVPSSGSDSIQIYIEKPDITPILLARKTLAPAGGGSGKARFCMHCGSRIPSSSRFCPICGKNQV